MTIALIALDVRNRKAATTQNASDEESQHGSDGRVKGYKGREIHVSTGAKVLAALALASFLVPIVVVLVSSMR